MTEVKLTKKEQAEQNKLERERLEQIEKDKQKAIKKNFPKGEFKPLSQRQKAVKDFLDYCLTIPKYHTRLVGKKALTARLIVQAFDDIMGTKYYQQLQSGIAYLSIPTMYKFFTSVFSLSCTPKSNKFFYDNYLNKDGKLYNDSGYLVLQNNKAHTKREKCEVNVINELKKML